MPHRIPHPFAPPRPGGTPTEELIDRHAHLVAVGLANCRAAQALKKEITRRQLETKNEKPETLTNDDDHYDPNEPRDKKTGKWTTDPDATDSKTNSPSQPTKPEPPKEETHLEPASTTEGIGLLLDLAGKGVHDLLAAWAFWRIGDDEDAWKQLGFTSDQLKQAGWPETVEEDEGTTGGKPFDQGKDMLSPPAQAAVTTAEGIVESTPRMAIAEADPLLGVYGFGATPQGFDYRQALITLFLPAIGKYSGDTAKVMAAGARVSNEAALEAFGKIGGAAGMASLIGADQLDRIRQLPPEKQKQALIEAAGTMGALFIIGMVGHGDSSEPEKTPDQPSNNVGPEKPTPKTQPESTPSQQKTGLGDSPKAPEPPADLKPYGGPGGGHHIPAKSVFKGDPKYDIDQALAMPNDELDRLHADHDVISGAQQKLYRDFAKRGQKLGWDDVEKIETEALVRGGVKSATVANDVVKRAIIALKAKGIEPRRIPWGG